MKFRLNALNALLIASAIFSVPMVMNSQKAHATISVATNVITYTGNGSTTDFSFPYLFYANSDLVVKVNGTTKTINVDYTVTGAGGQSGGTVTFMAAPASSAAVVIQRYVPYTQETDFSNFDGNPADVTEEQFDLTVMQAQQNKEIIDRSLKIPLGESNTVELPAAASRANKAVIFDADGDVTVSTSDWDDIESGFTDLSSSVTAAASSASAAASSASAAASSASDAASSASSASTSATNAASSATAAAASAASVAFDWEGQWLTATAYVSGNLVFNSGSSYIATADHTSGGTTEPGVGASWTSYWDLMAQQGSAGAGSGDMLAANNLSDVVSAATSRANLGLAIGSNVQAYDAELSYLAALTAAASKGIMFNSTGSATTYDLTAAGLALLDDAAASNQRTTLGLGTAATLNVGTSANNIVQLDGSAKLPAVDGSQLTNLPSTGGAVTLIATTTIAGGETTLDIKDIDEASCAAIKFIWNDIKMNSDGAQLLLRTSTNNGSTFDSSGYGGFLEYAAGTTAAYSANSSSIQLDNGVGNASNEKTSGELIVYNPSGADYKRIYGNSVYTNTDGTIVAGRVYGSRATAADTDAFRFLVSFSSFISGKIYTYCIKNS